MLGARAASLRGLKPYNGGINDQFRVSIQTEPFSAVAGFLLCGRVRKYLEGGEADEFEPTCCITTDSEFRKRDIGGAIRAAWLENRAYARWGIALRTGQPFD